MGFHLLRETFLGPFFLVSYLYSRSLSSLVTLIAILSEGCLSLRLALVAVFISSSSPTNHLLCKEERERDEKGRGTKIR